MKTLTDKKETFSFWMKEADTWFSKYIRLLYADSNGRVNCSCGCGRREHWTQMQASHYINRDNMATRYDQFNVVPAKRECNYYDPDHKQNIGIFISHKFGADVLINLLKNGHSLMKYTRNELQEIAENYKIKFQDLKREKKL